MLLIYYQGAEFCSFDHLWNFFQLLFYSFFFKYNFNLTNWISFFILYFIIFTHNLRNNIYTSVFINFNVYIVNLESKTTKLKKIPKNSKKFKKKKKMKFLTYFILFLALSESLCLNKFKIKATKSKQKVLPVPNDLDSFICLRLLIYFDRIS